MSQPTGLNASLPRPPPTTPGASRVSPASSLGMSVSRTPASIVPTGDADNSQKIIAELTSKVKALETQLAANEAEAHKVVWQWQQYNEQITKELNESRKSNEQLARENEQIRKQAVESDHDLTIAKTTISDVQSQLESSQKRVKELQDTILEDERLNRQAESVIKEWEKSHNQLQDQVNDLVQKLAEKDSEMVQQQNISQDAILDYQKKCEAVLKERDVIITRLDKDLKDATQHVNALSDQLKQKEEALIRLREEHEATAEDAKATVAEWQVAFKAKEDELIQQKDASNKVMQGLQSNIDQLKLELQRMTGERQSQSLALNNANEKVAAYEREMGEAQRVISEWQTRLNQEMEKSDDLEKKLTQMTRENAALNENVKESADVVYQWQDRFNQFEGEYKQVCEELDAKNSQILSLQAEIQHRDDIIKMRDSDMDNAREVVGQWEQANKMLERKVQDVQIESDKWKQRSNELQITVSSMSKELEEAKKTVFEWQRWSEEIKARRV